MWFAELTMLSVAVIGVVAGIALLSSGRLAYWYFDRTIGEFMMATERLVSGPRYADMRTLFRWVLPPSIIGGEIIAIVSVVS
jgi:hypothetical protein